MKKYEIDLILQLNGNYSFNMYSTWSDESIESVADRYPLNTYNLQGGGLIKKVTVCEFDESLNVVNWIKKECK